MSVKAIPRVTEVLTQISTKDAGAITKRLVSCRNADEAEAMVRAEFHRKWPHLFSLEALPKPR
jgi:phosphoenolpyruvate-protein kinase (PTS system EI component)